VFLLSSWWPVASVFPVRQDFCATVTTCVKKYGLWRLFLLAWGVCEFTQKLSLDSIYCLIFHVDRGASRGSVWLSWQTPLHHRYSALKPIKYQTLSLFAWVWITLVALTPINEIYRLPDVRYWQTRSMKIKCFEMRFSLCFGSSCWLARGGNWGKNLCLRTAQHVVMNASNSKLLL